MPTRGDPLHSSHSHSCFFTKPPRDPSHKSSGGRVIRSASCIYHRILLRPETARLSMQEARQGVGDDRLDMRQQNERHEMAITTNYEKRHSSRDGAVTTMERWSSIPVTLVGHATSRTAENRITVLSYSRTISRGQTLPAFQMSHQSVSGSH